MMQRKNIEKKIQDDEKLLRANNYPHGGKRWKLLDIIDGIKYTVFGVMFPTDEKQPDTTYMSELESEESTTQQGQGVNY